MINKLLWKNFWLLKLKELMWTAIIIIGLFVYCIPCWFIALRFFNPYHLLINAIGDEIKCLDFGLAIGYTILVFTVLTILIACVCTWIDVNFEKAKQLTKKNKTVKLFGRTK